MGFSWTSITATVTVATKAHMDQLVQNIKSVENSIQLGSVSPGSKFSWASGYDPFSKEKMEFANIATIRNAVDNLANYNYCRADETTKWRTHYSAARPSDKSTHRGGELSSKRGADWNDCGSNWSSNYDSNCSSLCGSNDDDHRGSEKWSNEKYESTCTGLSTN